MQRFKVFMVGSGAQGKTSLCIRYTHGIFPGTSVGGCSECLANIFYH